MNDTTGLHATVRALRAEFDSGFAQAPQPPSASRQNMLTIHVCGERYALRLLDVRGLHADRRILALPSALPELLGVAGFRGQVIPVYDLGALLGHTAASTPRWLVLAQGREPLALAFESFDAHVAVAAEHIVDGAARLHVRGALRIGELLLPLIDMQSLVEDVQRRAGLALQQRSKQT